MGPSKNTRFSSLQSHRISAPDVRMPIPAAYTARCEAASCSMATAARFQRLSPGAINAIAVSAAWTGATIAAVSRFLRAGSFGCGSCTKGDPTPSVYHSQTTERGKKTKVATPLFTYISKKGGGLIVRESSFVWLK